MGKKTDLSCFWGGFWDIYKPLQISRVKIYTVYECTFVVCIKKGIFFYIVRLPGPERGLCLWFMPTTRFPIGGCLGTSRSWVRCTSKGPICRDLGVSPSAVGDRATLLCARSPGTSAALPSQDIEKSPAPKLAFPTPFFSRSRPLVLVSGRCHPWRRVGRVAPSCHRTLRRGGDSRGRVPSCTPLPSSQPLRVHLPSPNSRREKKKPDPDPLLRPRRVGPPGRGCHTRGGICAVPWGCGVAPRGAIGAGGPSAGRTQSPGHLTKEFSCSEVQ